MANNPFHRWLIKQRVYCERESCYRYGAVVDQINGRDTVLCHEHASRLTHVRKSEQREERKQ